MSMSLKTAITKTLAYGKKYGVIYGTDEIRQRLISNISYDDKKINKTLKQIQIGKRNFYKNNEKYLKYEKAVELANMIANKFSDVLMIGLTGSVAAGYPKPSDDIDLMIVTKSNRLWYSRLLLRTYMFLYRIPHRKYGRLEKANEYCFNLWIDEGALILPKKERNLKNAMDLILMKPLTNKNYTYEKFIIRNGWAKKYVANGYHDIVSNFKLKYLEQKQKTKLLDKIINWLLFWPQYWYMKPKIGKGLIEINRAFFHPH